MVDEFLFVVDHGCDGGVGEQPPSVVRVGIGDSGAVYIDLGDTRVDRVVQVAVLLWCQTYYLVAKRVAQNSCNDLEVCSGVYHELCLVGRQRYSYSVFTKP